MWLVILGRQPELSLAELEAQFGTKYVSPIRRDVAMVEAGDFDINRFGGAISCARVLGAIGAGKLAALPRQLIEHLPPAGSKQNIGLSVYGDLPAREVGRLALELKKAAKKAGHKIRVVPNKEPVLSSAQVLHNQLVQPGNAEFVVAVAGGQAYIGQTAGVQDIDAYRQRDVERPARDARVGMLPPKLAQIMLNLALGPLLQNRQGTVGYKEEASSATSGTNVPRVSKEAADAVDTVSGGGVAGSAGKQAAAPLTVLDPFCGTGVVLQEALLLGAQAYGSDIAERMVRMSQTNLAELARRYPDIDIKNRVHLEVADARSRRWQPPIDAVVSEIYLGPAFSVQPDPAQLGSAVKEVDGLLSDTLKNLSQQLVSGARVVLAVPSWPKAASPVRLSSLDRLEEFGYTSTRFVHAPGDLVYAREDQIVARQLLVLTKN